MFGTKLGASAENAMDLYLRPETAQGIFVNFLMYRKLLVINCLSELHKLVKPLEMKLLQDNSSSE